MEIISEIFSKLIKFGIILLIISIPILILLAYGCLMVTTFTYIYSLFSENRYEFICDQSEILYKINKVGKITGTLTLIILIPILMYILIFN
jgi:hypothetical protein